MNKYLLLAMSFFFGFALFASEQKTPERPKRRLSYYESPVTPPPCKLRCCPSSVQRDKNYENYENRDAAKRWHEPTVMLINERTVSRWPSLWNANDNDDIYIERLAALARKDGTTLLHIAVQKNNVACMCDLIRYGHADLVAQNTKDLLTPLHLWAMNSDCTALQAEKVTAAIRDARLKRKESFPDKSFLGNDLGSSPLHVVCSHNLWNANIFKALIDCGHPLDCYNKIGQSFLHYLATSSNPSRKLQDIITLLRQYVLAPALLNKRSNSPFEQTALHIAVEQKNCAMVDYLLTRVGIDLDVQDHIGCTPLHGVSALLRHNRHDQAALYIYHKLIASGASQSIKNDDGETAPQLLPCKY